MLTTAIKEEIIAHAKEEYPKECCGLITLDAQQMLHCYRIENKHPEPESAFLFDPIEIYNHEEKGERVAFVYHSHPNQDSTLSPEDILSCEECDVPFLVVSYPEVSFTTYTPKDLSLELLGRPFIYSIYDCWTLVRDHFMNKHKLVFPPAPYRDIGWWKQKENEAFYFDCLTGLGNFVEVPKESIRTDDIALIQLRSDIANHLVLYTCDGQIMHHVADHKSSIANWGGYWEKNCMHVLRHKSLL